MKKKYKWAIVVLSSIVILFFFITVVNQMMLFVNFISNYSALLGQAVFVLFSLLLLTLICLPAWFFIRLPARLSFPDPSRPDDVAAYKKKLAENLNKNRHVIKSGVTVDETNLDEAMKVLDDAAHNEVKETASVVFVSTAVSQSGKLDAFIVFTLLVKMVWRIAHIYNQRPSYTSLFSLYANVAGTTLIAGSVDEIDISEQLEPVLGELIGASVFGAIPGLSQISAFTFSCLMEGSINSFLALRMGEVTIGYCQSVSKPGRKELRKSASRSAALRLRRIISEFSWQVITSIKKAGQASTKKYVNDKTRWFRWGKKEDETDIDITAEEYLGIEEDEKNENK